MIELSIYRDDFRYIVGRPEWQRSISTTVGIAEVHSLEEAKEIAADASKKGAEELEEMKRYYDTWDRFEDACETGHFGCEW